ncbi:MAG: hypothetical protein OHK0019_14740 [Saprospiraceae bacterium]
MAGTIVQHIRGQELEIPRQLTRYTPISSDECIGRDEDLKKLADALLRSPKVVVVNGLGGIGKTTLAKFWLQGVLADYDHFAWIEMAGNDGRRDQPARTFLETVAYHPELAVNLRLSFDEKEPLENRFHHIMNALRQLDGRNLLVVDNAGADLEQKEIREQLPLPPVWQVLVTSRNKLHGYELVPLDRLSPEHAKDLFRLYFSGDCTEAELDELLREVDYHTLTVELLAKTLENHLGSLTISELTAKLKRRQLADPELQRRISLNHSAEETEVYLHLLTTFDVAGLDDEERLLLARFAALPPGGAYSAAQLEEWLKISPDGKKNLHETLLRLDRKGWLTRSAQNTFSLHRMIQQAVLYQLQPALAELAVLVEVFTKKLDFDTSTNFTLLFPWIPYAEQVLATLPENERDSEGVGKLKNNLGIVYRDLGDYERARDLLEAALASNLKNFGKEHPNVARSQINLGAVFLKTGKKEKAKALFQQAYDLFKKRLGEQHPNTQTAKEWLESV